MYNNYKKRYVDVLAEFKTDNQIIPLSIIGKDGHIFKIDKITNICKAASLKSGGAGIRYSCFIGGKEFYLFLEENRWFLELK